MKFYLKVINPTLAILIMLICFWSATYDSGNFELFGIVSGAFSTYFFAKGLFAGTSIFLLGNILLNIISERNSSDLQKYTFKEYIYILSLSVFSVGILISIIILQDINIEEETVTVRSANPDGIVLTDTARITESDYLSFSGKVMNESGKNFHTITVVGEVFSSGRFLDSIDAGIGSINAEGEKFFILESERYKNSNLTSEIQCKYSIISVE